MIDSILVNDFLEVNSLKFGHYLLTPPLNILVIIIDTLSHNRNIFFTLFLIVNFRNYIFFMSQCQSVGKM